MDPLSTQNTRSIGTPSEMGTPCQCVPIYSAADFVTVVIRAQLLLLILPEPMITNLKIVNWPKIAHIIL